MSAIDAGGVGALIRGAFLDDTDVIIQVLLAAGVRAIEVSLTSPRALDQTKTRLSLRVLPSSASAP